MSNTPLPKAVLFDMDGVLVDARDWHYQALNQALGHFGMEIDYHTHLTVYDGLPTKVKLQLLTENKGLPKDLHDLINSLKQIYTIRLTYINCKPIFNVIQLVKYLSNKNIKIAVCSNSIKSTIEAMMDLSNLTPMIDLILSNEDVSKSKPDPEIYNKAMQFFDLNPSECLIFEDSDHGIKAAKASGANLKIVTCPEDLNINLLK